ncbi:SGNH/GDSL hydrolase family protein [Klebsiella aerogenes]|uniref:SGNH/GDSL hydrolase family protein n=1 Tax=Klebsiella aerogenes TaxID=548 RepID=UPI00254F99CA|nr:SGNH/GDSL hydrolase family protein [Klebsiella aerogenes]MEC5622018.1 SGNH/GDSL hydrolase family protein [Klebsiella aerogenes]
MAFNPPLGTTNADVFMGNVQRLDELVNGQPTTVPDRAGDPLYSWRGIHQNLIPLSRQYMTIEAAQADIANIMQGSTTFIRSQDNDYLAYEVMNVNGILQPTGRKQASQEFIEMVHNFARVTDMRTRGINTVSRKKRPLDILTRQGRRLFSINENGEKELPGKSFADYMNILRSLLIGTSSIRRARAGYLFNLVIGGFRVLAVRDDGNATLEYRGIPLETHQGLLQNTFGGFGDSLTANGLDGNAYNARSWQVWASLFSNGQLQYVGQWATGGYTTADMIRVHLQPAIEAKPRFITFLGGRNDVIQKDGAGNFKFTIATVTCNIRYILTQFRKNGIIPVVCSMAAQNNSDPDLKARENAINAFTRAYAIEQGFPFVDMRSVTVDPETDGWKAGYNGKLQDGSPDPSHPAPLGAFHMGKSLAEALAPFMMPVYPQMAISNPVTSGGPNAIINPLFLDIVNGLPSGWVVESGTVSLTTAPDVVGNVLVVTGAGNTSARVSQTIPVTPGERRKFSFRVKFDVDENAATACFLEANGANIAGIRPWNHPTDGFRTFSYDVVIPEGMTEMKLTIVANRATTSVGQMGLLKLEEV